MLKKINRIQKRSDFVLLREKGQLVSGSLMGMSWLNIGTEEENKFGFVISKRISKKAVERNKIKRLLSESIKNNLNKVKGKGKLVVFLAKRVMLGKKMEEVEVVVGDMLNKIK